jgi:hypothetical protein
MLMVMGMTYLLGASQVPPSPPAIGAVMAVMAGPSSRYARDIIHWFTPFPPLLLMFLHRR